MTMTPAEFAIIRRLIGLTHQELADRLNVQLRTVQRWEKGDSGISEGVADDLRGLRLDHDKDTHYMARSASSGEPVPVERSNWWLAVAARVMAENPEALFEWKD